MYSPEIVVPRYERVVERMLLNHATGEDAGAFITEDGVPSGTHGANARFVAMAAYCYFDPASRVRGNRTLFDRIERALQFQIGLVQETGLIDLESTNWQSPPDTAFTVQLLCPIVDLSVLYDEVDGAARIRELLTEFVRLAASGIVDGGFHTPNHRWVICSALAYAQEIVPALDVSDYIHRMLAEGIDINEDGEYSERSTGIYTAVTNRALFLMAEKLGMPELLEHIRKSLDFVSTLFQPDGSVVTAMSSRQDRGKPVVPQQLADIFLIMGHLDQNREWMRRAELLVETTSAVDPSAWLLYPFVRFPQLRGGTPTAAHSARHDQTGQLVQRLLPDSGLFRVRDGEFALTVIRDDHDLLDLAWGPIRVHAMRIAGSYFGRLRFEAKKLEAIRGGVRASIRAHDLEPVGYYLPLDRPVGLDEIHEIRDAREAIRLPQFDLQLDITWADGTLLFHLVSSGGIPGVLGQIEVCFDVPHSWHTDTAVIYPDAGAGGSVILKDGYGTVRSGPYALRIGPGTRAHRVAAMRGALPSTRGWRVKIPLRTPIDHVLSLEPGYWSEPEDGFVSRGDAPKLGGHF